VRTEQPATFRAFVDQTEANLWPDTLSTLAAGRDLSIEQAAAAMRAIMDGRATPVQIGAFLLALRTKGESVDEVQGLALTMLSFAHPVEHTLEVADTCGTGGDRSGTFNISTIGAIVAAGAGVTIAKHGNRAASSRCGSADLLEGLEVKIDLDPEGVSRCLSRAGIAFMFAPVFHPAMAHAGPVRRELRVPTVFNFLGPLTNPARPRAQVVGCSDDRMLPIMAEVLARRGATAKLFRGDDGLDELTTTGPSTVFDVRDGEVRRRRLDPTELGLRRAVLEDLRGGEVSANVEIARRVIDGEEGSRREVVLLNAAAALEVAGMADTLEAGLSLAARSIDSGAAKKTLDRWIEESNALP
jgi:anthranilate phosphoribosyltransferase